MLPIWNKYDHYSSGSIILGKKKKKLNLEEHSSCIIYNISLGYMYCR